MTFLGNYSFNYLTGLIEFKYQQRMENVLVKDFLKSNEKSSTGDVFKYQNLLKATTKNQNIFLKATVFYLRPHDFLINLQCCTSHLVHCKFHGL